MRRHGLVLLCTIALAALAATAARAHSNAQIRAEQQHERSVVAQIDQIGRNLEGVVQQYDGAKLELQRVKESLRRNQYELHLAKGNFRAAQKRVMARLYSLYVDGSPSTVDVIAGATSFSQMISRAESAQVLSNQDAALGEQALSYEHTVQKRERQLQQLKSQRQATVLELASKKQTIESALSRQKQLLASIHTTLQQLWAQEAQHEREIKAEEEARLQAQLQAQREAARQAAARKRQAPPATGIVPPPVTVPPVASGAGHPQAASIALGELGVPYVWGGASPAGFDCSGLVMWTYAQLGISLPHYTVAQWNATLPISQSSAQAGDLVFFNGLSHVGIYLGNGQMVDAPHTGSVVRVESIYGFGSIDGFRRVP